MSFGLDLIGGAFTFIALGITVLAVGLFFAQGFVTLTQMAFIGAVPFWLIGITLVVVLAMLLPFWFIVMDPDNVTEGKA